MGDVGITESASVRATLVSVSSWQFGEGLGLLREGEVFRQGRGLRHGQVVGLRARAGAGSHVGVGRFTQGGRGGGDSRIGHRRGEGGKGKEEGFLGRAVRFFSCRVVGRGCGWQCGCA